MEDHNFEKYEGKRLLFFKGCAFILAIALVVVLGALFLLGTLSVMYKVSPGKILYGMEGFEKTQKITEEKQKAEISQPREQLDLPELEEEIGGKESLLEEMDNAISKVVEEVNPMVVNIRITVIGENVFGEKIESEGLGSGVVYTKDGYIITNNHVAGQAEKIIVTFFDGKEYPAQLVGGDSNTDIAVVKIEAEEELRPPALFLSTM